MFFYKHFTPLGFGEVGDFVILVGMISFGWGLVFDMVGGFSFFYKHFTPLGFGMVGGFLFCYKHFTPLGLGCDEMQKFARKKQYLELLKQIAEFKPEESEYKFID